MPQVWIYTVGANSNPDLVECNVPWRVDQELIFFGPCMKSLSKRLRKEFLKEEINHAPITEDLFIVGVNGNNKQRTRKVIWAGKLSEVMTFAEADKRLKEERFKELREDRDSPLHVRPLMEGGKLIGYEHVSALHIDKWISDLVWRPDSKISNYKIKVEGRKLLLRQGTPWQTFDLDCCLLLKNIFFAQGQGISFDQEALKILRQAQSGRIGIDDYAIFGIDLKGHINGRRGNFLIIKDDLADQFIAWLYRVCRTRDQQRHKKGGRAKTCCT